MKKVLCILMIVALLMGTCMITASAEGITEEEKDKWLFFQKFSDRFAFPQYGDPIAAYEELYYHYDSDGEIEWALIYGHQTFGPPWLQKPCLVFEDRIVRIDEISINGSHFHIYDVVEDRFVHLSFDIEDTKYYDIVHAFFVEQNIGEIIGDINADNELTIKDATYIQKCLAGIESFPENDGVAANYYTEGFGHLAYLSDFNRDGLRNIKDATAIQKYIAGIA